MLSDLQRAMADSATEWPDFQEGLTDYLAAKFGVQTSDRHPVADLIERAHVSSLEIAAFCVNPNDKLTTGELRKYSSNVFMAAGDTGVFRRAMETAAVQMATARANALMGKIRDACLPVTMRDFREGRLPVVDVSDFEPRKANVTDDLIRYFAATATGEPVQIRKDVRNLLITREMLFNDDFGGISATLSALGAAAGRAVAKRFADLLTTNGNLVDGSAWISADNTVASGALNGAGLGLAVDALANTATGIDSDIAAADPAFLVVPTSHAVTAQILVSSMSVGDMAAMRVVALPYLNGSNYFYVLPDPAQQPAVALASIGENLLDIEQLPADIVPLELDGLAYRLRLYFDLAPASRSIVRGTLS